MIFGYPTEQTLPDGTKIEFPLPGGPFVFGSDWSISAGSADSGADSGMKWNQTNPEFPPNPDAAR
jgi:hypothetical protein